MALSVDTERRLVTALASPAAAKELADLLTATAGDGTQTLTCAGLRVTGPLVVLGSVVTVPAAGTAAGDATALTGATHFVTGADGTNGVSFPATPEPGRLVGVINGSPDQPLLVYAGGGGTVQGRAPDAPATLPPNRGGYYACVALEPPAWWPLW